MTTLGEVHGLRAIQTGPFGTQLKADEYNSTGNGAPVVSVGEIREGFIRIKPDTPRVGPEVQTRLGHFMLDERDVVVSRKGAVDRSAWISKSYGPLFLGSDAIAVRFDDPDTARFYSYVLRERSVRGWLVRHAPGTTMLSMNGAVLGAVPVPPSNGLRMASIVEVLGALDDKIAANRSCIALTSELLDAKYRSTAKHRSELLFQDFADVGGGATPSTKKLDLWGQGVAWATPTDVTGLEGVWLDRTERTISPAGLASISSPLYPVGSIAMTSRATIGAVALLGVPMAVNQGFIVLQPKDPSNQLWLYCQLCDRVDELQAWANGATFLELPKKIFRGLPVELGSESDMREFAAFSTPLMERLHGAQRENAYLAATRDELLPLLMSGKITVKDAEKTVEEVV